MRSDRHAAPVALKLAAWGAVAFLHIPLALIILYAFSAEDKSYVFPPPALTTRWFGVAWQRDDVWARDPARRSRSRRSSTAIALVLGTLAAAALARARFFGRDAIALLLDPADRAAGHHQRHLAALGVPHAGDPVLVLDHRDRPRHLLRRGRVQQRGGAAAPAAPEPDRGVDGPRRRRLPDACATWCCRSSARRCWPARCWPSR